ncbi:MAG: phytanoyl-CoA dioxygenase family protein [Terracidiphilus sp.]
MAPADPATELIEQGAVLMRDILAKDSLRLLKEAAERCFDATDRGEPFPERYRFNRLSNSLLLRSLLDFGCGGTEELLAPLSAPVLETMFSAAIGHEWICNMEQSWVRKKFAPRKAPARHYHPQGWHQDGALGVRFPTIPGPPIPMTELLTCWIPLNPCGNDSPGLEFVRHRQASLLHFTELDDAAIRERFPSQEFWAPALEFGDALIFLNSVLHRTCTHPEMRNNRLSIEYRIFPRNIG